jgi:predicted permease
VTALLTDLRFAVRSMIAQPVYSGTIVLMMTLGIAGNAAVFRIFNGLFLRPLPFEAPEQLVDLDTRAPRWDLDYTGVAYADFAAWRDGNRTFRGMAVFTVRGANLAGDDGGVRVSVVQASHDLAPVLGLQPLRGRLFTSDEDAPEGPAVALLGHGFWERQYGSDPGVIGSTALLDGVPHEVIGVLPRQASFIAEADLWVPLQEDPDEHDSFYLDGVGRLLPGVSAAAAQEDLTRVHKGLTERWDVNEATFPVVGSLRDRYLGDFRLGSRVLLGAVAVVLLIACANVAGLMLARSLERSREVAVRLALGAGRGRIVRQLLTESVVLAGTGALVGSVLGVWGSGVLVGGLADQFPTWVTFDLDRVFVAFTVGVTVAAAVLFGLAPALQTAKAEPTAAVRTATGRATASLGRRRAMGLLVTAEVALAFVLLIVAGLTLRDLQALTAVDPGFRTEGVLSWRVQLPDDAYPSAQARLAFWDDHLERVRALPGVTGAAGTTVLPLAGHSGWFFEVEDAPPRPDDEANPVVLMRAVTPGYLDLMDIEVLDGRALTDFDGREDESGAAVVNERFVQRFLSHRADPVGARIRTQGSDGAWWTVVGVTRDTKHYGLAEEMRPAIHVPLRQLPRGYLAMTATTGGDPTELTGAIRGVLRDQDPGLAVFDVETMKQRLDDSLWARRASSWLVAAFSTVALLLAVAGIYGVISYGVRQRVQEIGIRMALGARQRQVANQVLRQGIAIVGVGAVLGGLVGFVVARLVSGELFAARASDPWIYVGATALLLTVATVANVLPARRAAGLDPMKVLRSE